MKGIGFQLVCAVVLSAAVCVGQTGSVSIANYAGFTGSFPVAPGSIASAYGTFGTVTTTPAPSLAPMPKELAGIRLRLNNTDAPLYFVSSAQINFVVPVATPAGRHDVEVFSGSTSIARGSVNVYDFAPGLASSDSTTARQGLIQNQDFSLNTASARALRGQVVSLYATGCGTVNPQIQDGTPPSGLSRATADVKVYISVKEAAVQFAGAHPTFPGICQVNAVVPSDSFITGQVPIAITVNGVPSNTVSVWIE